MCCEADTCRSESKQKIRMNFRNTSTQICISKPLDCHVSVTYKGTLPEEVCVEGGPAQTVYQPIH